MTANAEAFQLSQSDISSEIKQYNLNTVSGALLLACDLIEDLQEGAVLSAEEIEFVAHASELAEGVRQ